MPIIKSAIKKMNQDVKRTKRNTVFRNRMKSNMKAVEEGAHDTVADLSERLNKANASIDTALKKRLIKKNNAARKKSRLARLVNEAGK
jgi:small subunit ribosomal protein S20